jgi:hypothetical protein
MCRFVQAGAFGVTLVLITTNASAAAKRISLETKAGVESVKAQWRYADVKIVEVPGTGPDGKPNTTYNIEPRASAGDFDDSAWPIIAPETLKKPRGGGQVCFAWYRIKITLPDEAAGKAGFFQTTVDDYGEVWVDGKLPRMVGKGGGAIVAGFNTPNRLELRDPRPGKVYSIAVFGINGPISASVGNRIFLRDTFLELVDSP